MLPPNPASHLPAESEDPTLGKRKASEITTDHEAVPTVTQKRKKRRKVGPDQSISATSNSATTAEPPVLGTERGVVPGDAPSTTAVAQVNQLTISQTQKKKKKNAGAGQSDSTVTDPVERRIEPPREQADAPVEPQTTKKRKKTVVLDLSTVIQSPSTTQACSDPLFSLYV